MRQLNLHSPFATTRARLLLAGWAILTAAILVLVITYDLNRAQSQLEQLGAGLMQHVSDRALVSETSIEGFAAFVASLGDFDHARAQEYARMLLTRYPFLYMFEVANRVDGGQREALERRLAARYPGFRIKRFTYDSDRSWQPVEPADYYYPLVFQEPMLAGMDNLVGLDIHSSDFLKAAMEASFVRGEPVATHPFELAEGGRGYVLHRSVEHIGLRPPSAFEARQYALLALKSESLFSALMAVPRGVTVRLAHRDLAAGDPAGNVLAVDAPPVSAAARLLLPRFRKTLALGLTSQPFVLALEWQLEWGDLDLLLMALVITASLLLWWGVRTYARQYIEAELVALEDGGRLFELANFDPLTGLANRNRLMDFLEGALARARRHRLQLAVLFIDLDGFKTVNDSHGHASGDLILVEVARRLSRHLRDDELLARYGGDEFVWVTDGATRPPELDGLIRRLRQEFEQPFHCRELRLQLGVSIGHALYPQDGRNIAALFDAADAGMYRDKRSSPAGRGRATSGASGDAAGTAGQEDPSRQR